MKFNTNLDIATFGAVSKQIADGYFDEDGLYSPAIGKIMAMCIFFNVCVDKSKFDAKFAEGITDLADLEEIISKDFIQSYNSAIEWDGEALDFANAYNAAMDIVDTKKSSVGYAVDVITIALNKMAQQLSENMSPEMVDNLKQIAAALGETADIGDAIVKSYGKQNFHKE